MQNLLYSSSRAPDRRRLALTAAVALASALLLVILTQVGRAPAGPGERLPDLDQRVPTDLRVNPVEGGFSLGFDSVVVNRPEAGELTVTGRRIPGTDLMDASQVVQGGPTIPDVGRLQYVRTEGHVHWHFLDFARYELYSVTNPGVVLKDRKQGFCLVDNASEDDDPSFCKEGQPGATDIRMGIRPGGEDLYVSFFEGQEIRLDPQSAPSGQYVLVNRTDVLRPEATNLLREARTDNNAASVLLELTWPPAGANQPAVVRVLRTCDDTWDCFPPGSPGRPGADPPAPPAPPAPPPPPPPPATGASTPPAVRPLGSGRASQLARRALARTFRRLPRRLAMTCLRDAPTQFTCRVRWRRAGVTYRGRVTIVAGAVSARYRLAVDRRRAGARRTTQVKRSGALRSTR